MIFIAHRGNIKGPNPAKENRMDHILTALELRYHVEIDVWYEDKQFWLGHDEPKYKTGISLFSNPKVWLHAKNAAALKKLSENSSYNYFWQDGDDYTITSKGHIWCHCEVEVLPNSVCVLPERGFKGDLKTCYAVCSDFDRYATLI